MNRPFITDFGEPITLFTGGEPACVIPRFGVWVYHRIRGRYEVVETGDTAYPLAQKYGILDKEIAVVSHMRSYIPQPST